MMRIWGRLFAPVGDTPAYEWVKVVTDVNGDNTAVYLTNLVQVLLLVRGESPFYANYGIPAIQSVIQQIAPDLFTQITVQQFSQFFAALQIVRVQGTVNPTYNVSVTTFTGAILFFTVSGPVIPQ